jgi:hypothetical protein
MALSQRYHKTGRTKRTVQCAHCSKDTHNGKFCSTDCSFRFKEASLLKRILDDSIVGTVALKRYVLSLNPKCSLCPCTDEWNGLKLVLHLDHIDGDSDNDRLSNVRLLCPNCHSQTETYCSRNKTNPNSKRSKRLRRAPSRCKQIS